jgi:hypothetical protein
LVDSTADGSDTGSGSDDESSSSSSSRSSSDEENAIIRVGDGYQCTDIPFPAIEMAMASRKEIADDDNDARAGQVVWDPTRIAAPELQSYLTALRHSESDANDVREEEEHMTHVDPWPRDALGPKPQAEEHDKDPCAGVKRGLIPSEHPNVKPLAAHPVRIDIGLHHLAENNYDVSLAGTGLYGLIKREKDTAAAHDANLMAEAIKTYGKDLAAVCRATNEAAEAKAVGLGGKYERVTVAHVTEFYYSKWRHTNACEQWRRSAQYRQIKEQSERRDISDCRNRVYMSRLVGSDKSQNGRKKHRASHRKNGDRTQERSSVHSDSDEESESESERKREKRESQAAARQIKSEQEEQKRKRRESQAAARKAELEATRALQQSLRASPPDIHTTGTVDPRVDGNLPNEWMCNRAEILHRPTAGELGTWARESLGEYWGVRWRAWERETLTVLQHFCARLSLAQHGDKFDLVLRLTRFDMGGGSSALLQTDDLVGIPNTATGQVSMIGDTGGLLQSAKHMPLPDVQVLRSWTLESQREFWLWRWREWERKTFVECQAACAACQPPLWATEEAHESQTAGRALRARLCVHEFAPEILGARDFAAFYELEGQYLEVQFDDGLCESRPSGQLL